jgi:hypothetical protein
MNTDRPEKYEIEYIFVVSPKLLYSYISNVAGLANWFAEKVEEKDHIITFYWEDSIQQAIITAKDEPDYVRFKWLDDTFDTYFEFRIDTDSIDNAVTLIITDFARPEEQADAKLLWNSSIKKLLRVIGGKLINTQ